MFRIPDSGSDDLGLFYTFAQMTRREYGEKGSNVPLSAHNSQDRSIPFYNNLCTRSNSLYSIRRRSTSRWRRRERGVDIRCISARSDPDNAPDSSHDKSRSKFPLRSEAIAVASVFETRSTVEMIRMKVVNARIGAGCNIGNGDKELHSIRQRDTWSIVLCGQLGLTLR